MTNESKILIVFLSFTMLLACDDRRVKQTGKSKNVAEYRTVSDISEEDILYHISVLASDSLEGRKAGTVGERKAGNYIRRCFATYNLDTYYEDYYYPFAYPKYIKEYDCEFRYDTITASYKKDFSLLFFADTSIVSGDVFFVGDGYFYTKGKYTIDSYQDVDVNGKWVMFFEDNHRHAEMSLYGAPGIVERYNKAQAAGAAGVLAIYIDEKSPDRLISNTYVSEKYTIPAFRLSQKTANRLLNYGNTSVEEMLEKIEEKEKVDLTASKKFIRLSIPIQISAVAYSQDDSIRSHNMVAFLKGRDPVLKDEYIILGAHYDHLGKRIMSYTATKHKEEIYYGADDNASGTAGLLELAEKLSTEKNLKRSIIFMAFGAEEEGLRGSYHITDHLPVDVSKIKMMVNLDMIGRLDSGKLWVNSVQKNILIENVLQELNDAHPDLNLHFSSDQRGNSDHFPFYRRNIPVAMFTTGVHKEYHTPNDTIGSINIAGEKKILDLVYDFIVRQAEKR